MVELQYNVLFGDYDNLHHYHVLTQVFQEGGERERGSEGLRMTLPSILTPLAVVALGSSSWLWWRCH